MLVIKDTALQLITSREGLERKGVVLLVSSKVGVVGSENGCPSAGAYEAVSSLQRVYFQLLPRSATLLISGTQVRDSVLVQADEEKLRPPDVSTLAEPEDVALVNSLTVGPAIADLDAAPFLPLRPLATGVARKSVENAGKGTANEKVPSGSPLVVNEAFALGGGRTIAILVAAAAVVLAVVLRAYDAPANPVMQAEVETGLIVAVDVLPCSV